MKKTNIAVAALALIASAGALADGVTVYGYLDAGVQHADPKGSASSKTQLVSGLLAPNVIGFKGEEKLGDGLSANFALENRLELANGASSGSSDFLFNVAKVGLNSHYGALNLGRTVDSFWGNGLANFDVTAGANMGSAVDVPLLLGTSGVFHSNSLQYVAPSFAGINAAATWVFKDNVANGSGKNQYSMAATYATGPFSVGAGYAQHDNADADSRKGYFVAGGYDAGFAKVNAIYAEGKDNVGGANKAKVWGLNGALPLNAVTLTAGYYDYSNAVAGKSATVGALYSLSKRTRLFANFQHTTGDVGINVGNSANPDTNGAAITTDAGNAFTVGIGHSF